MRLWKFIFALALAVAGYAAPLNTNAGEGEYELNDLPEEMILEIFSWLDEISLSNAGSVNQQFNQLAECEILWKPLLDRVLPESVIFNVRKVPIMDSHMYTFGGCAEKWAPKVTQKKGISANNIQKIELTKINVHSATYRQIVLGRSLAKLYKEKFQGSRILDEKNLNYLKKAAYFGNEYAIHELCKAVIEGRYRLETHHPENIVQMLSSFIEKGSVAAAWHLKKFYTYNDPKRLELKKETNKWIEIFVSDERPITNRQRAYTY